MRQRLFEFICFLFGYKPGEYQKINTVEVEVVLSDRKVLQKLSNIRKEAEKTNKLLKQINENRPSRV